MRRLLPVLVSSAIVALGLYGVLNAVDHPAPDPEDPWLDAWAAAGLRGQQPQVSSEPEKHLMFGDGRELFKSRAFAGTQLRRYVVQGVHVQVVILPRADLAPAFPEGRAMNFGWRARGSRAHLCRRGRNFLLVKTSMFNWLGLGDGPPTPASLVEKLFDVFEKTADRFP